jgi:uridine phosphorylase
MNLNSKMDNFNLKKKIEYNLEYGCNMASALLGHNALSLNAIIANRATGTFSADPNKALMN